MRDKFVAVESPSHPDARKLHAFWRERMNAGGFVMGRDVPSRPIARLLPNLAVYEPLADGSDMRARLAGDGHRRRFNGEIKGRLLSELFPAREFAHHCQGSFNVLRSGKPRFVDSRMMRAHVMELHLEVVLLPMTAPDGISKWLLTGLFYFD